MQNATLGFPRYLRLSNISHIDRLFSCGQSINSFPIKLVFAASPAPQPRKEGEIVPSFQVLFSIPKRQVRKATARNRIRRQLREAFRLQHQVFFPPALFAQSALQWHVAIIFIGGKKVFDYAELSAKLVSAFQRLSLKIVSAIPSDSAMPKLEKKSDKAPSKSST